MVMKGLVKKLKVFSQREANTKGEKNDENTLKCISVALQEISDINCYW